MRSTASQAIAGKQPARSDAELSCMTALSVTQTAEADVSARRTAGILGQDPVAPARSAPGGTMLGALSEQELPATLVGSRNKRNGNTTAGALERRSAGRASHPGWVFLRRLKKRLNSAEDPQQRGLA